MKGNPAAYELRAPRNLEDALAILAAAPDEWRPFAGGTDLMVLLDAGRLPAKRYVSLWDLAELRGIRVDDDALTIGAMTTYSDVLADGALAAEYPLLVQAAAQTGTVATQNRGTLGGNIANASPAADTPPALLVYDAELELVSLDGVRRVPYETFHTGYKTMDLTPGEIIARIRLPRRASGWADTYRKVGTRSAQAISKVCFAAAMRVRGDVVDDVRVAFASVAPTVVRCTHVERAIKGRKLDRTLPGRAVKALARDIAPIDDVRSTSRYRMRVAGNLLAEFLAPGSQAAAPLG